MKQSKSRKSRETTAFLYERLSRDDNLDGDSYSIQNQKKLLTKVAKEKGYTNLVHFYDDGISGVTMDRPGFTNMIQEIENGKAAAVFVKDLSRLGRNYIEVGRLTEEFFPEHDIRLVAVSDGIDTDEGENELAPIKNLFNEWYARDISKKRRISNKIKGNSGEPMGQPPYGYIKDPDNPKRWIVDETAAAVVRKIYRMSLDGMGIEQIADALSKEGILTPRFYWQARGVNRAGKPPKYGPCHWNSSTVTKILSLQEYCGDVLNFKTYSKSYKNKRRLENDRELDSLFEHIYEDNVAGKLTDERFARMSAKYEGEQKELRAKIKALQDDIERTKSKAATADMFISAVRKYTRARKLTPRMLDELVQRIEVHQAEKVDGVWVQRLTIHYNCVGAITLPDALTNPMPDIIMNTRKGVYVSYQPDSRAG